MKIYKEIKLNEFEFWNCGKFHSELLTVDELNRIDKILSKDNEFIEETKLNDLFWHDFNYICSLINLDDNEVLERENYHDNY